MVAAVAVAAGEAGPVEGRGCFEDERVAAAVEGRDVAGGVAGAGGG